ncbi:MAG: glucose 1-dehydrogenase [Candidatus Bathyarchaeia archaeon]
MGGILEGKVVLITGGASGLGRATAILAAKEGAKVAIVDLDEQGGQEVTSEIRISGGEAIFLKADVTVEQDVISAINGVIHNYGRLDGAHNNVGIEQFPRPLTELSEEEWDKVINVNLKSVFLCMKHEIKQFIKQNSGGSIVNTSSIAGIVGAPMIGSYVASKHGIVGLTKAAAAEFGRNGIRINCVCPAGMRGTAMFKRVEQFDPLLPQKVREAVPMGRDAEPSEVAEAVVWLLSDKASYINGHALSVDGGYVIV